MAFRFYILYAGDGEGDIEFRGTDNAELAMKFSEDDDYFVIDAAREEIIYYGKGEMIDEVFDVPRKDEEEEEEDWEGDEE